MFGSALSDLLAGSGNKRQRPDFRQSFFISLAKVLGAAAWIDGPINQAEVNIVKSLLNELSPRLTTRELQRVQRYLAEPVPREHWSELLADLSEFTRRRARLQFALERLQALLSADGAPTQAESDLYHQAQTLLGWRDLERGSDAGADTAAAEQGTAAKREAASAEALAGPSVGAGQPPDPTALAVMRRRPQHPRIVRRRPRRAAFVSATWSASRVWLPPLPSPTGCSRAAAVRLSGPGGGGPPPRKLAVLAAALAHVTMRRASTVGEDAELVGYAGAVSGVDDAVAEAVLDAAREQPATGCGAGRAGRRAERLDQSLWRSPRWPSCSMPWPTARPHCAVCGA